MSSDHEFDPDLAVKQLEEISSSLPADGASRQGAFRS
jgi:hypothetical protein